MAVTILDSPTFAAADLKTFLPLVYLVAALLIGAVVIVLVGRWRRARPSLGPSASEQLAKYRTLYEQGTISQEEYNKLRSLLAGEIRKNLDLPVPADKAAPPGDQPPST